MAKRKALEDKKSENLWNSFFESNKKNPAILSALVDYYYPWVKRVALKVAEEMGWRHTPEELASFGAEALFTTIPAYDRERGVRFESFATLRVKGAMTDGLRREDDIPRSVRIASNQFDKHKQNMQHHLGRRVSDVELVSMSGMDEIEYHRNHRKYSASSMGSIDSHEEHEESIRQDANDNLVDNTVSTPDANLRRREFFSKLMSGCSNKKEQLIIYLYYYKGMTMDCVARAIGLSESRVSQMHKKIISRLRDKVIRNPSFFDEEVTTYIRSSNHSHSIF
jgi:RNA polymerase sigma factor for flagellar operon FliA